MQKVAEARGVPMAQVILAWMLTKPGVTAHRRRVQVHHLEDAVAAFALTRRAEEITGSGGTLPRARRGRLLLNVVEPNPVCGAFAFGPAIC